MPYVMVDIESDGPIPGDFSMISIGAVIVDPDLDKTFYRKLKPISSKYNPEALAVSGHSREETFSFDDPAVVMTEFRSWLLSIAKGKLIFISDNNGFDWMFVCWYFHHFLGENPFGYSSQNLGSLYKGIVRDTFQNFKHLLTTVHSHHPVDDAVGNAQAFLKIVDNHGVKINLH